MELMFSPYDAATLKSQAERISSAAGELAAFGETDPGLAAECGVEINALEARTILSGGAPARVIARTTEAIKHGRPAVLPIEDIQALSRLEAVVALGNSRISLRLASLDAEASQEPFARLSGLAGLATGAIGLVKSFI
jgi:hypothetical protein